MTCSGWLIGQMGLSLQHGSPWGSPESLPEKNHGPRPFISKCVSSQYSELGGLGLGWNWSDISLHTLVKNRYIKPSQFVVALWSVVLRRILSLERGLWFVAMSTVTRDGGVVAPIPCTWHIWATWWHWKLWVWKSRLESNQQSFEG